MGDLTDSRLVWFAGLMLLMVLLRFGIRRLGRRPLVVIDIRIVRQQSGPPSPEELRLREEIRAATAALGLGRATSVQNAKTSSDSMHVWLYVPNAEGVTHKVEESLSAYPVKVAIVGPPVDLSGAAMVRRGVPMIWKALINSWRETRRQGDR